MKITIIADNGGGIVLQAHRYVHSYEARTNAAMAKQVSRDLCALLLGETPHRDWDGNEIETIPPQSYDQDISRNGGYRWYEGTPQQVVKAIMDEPWGAAVEAVAVALKQRLQD